MSLNIELHWDAGLVVDEILLDWLVELPVFSISYTVRRMLFFVFFIVSIKFP
jgi:hypothetical protein